ncbi:MAG: HPr family phosphocarrier protein [Thermodesulfobacteriota bacterium]
MEKTFLIKNKLGLHARASSFFVQMANRFESEIFVTKDGQEVNGKSILGVLMLAAPMGAEITLRVEGNDAAEAIEALGELINDRFGEE